MLLQLGFNPKYYPFGRSKKRMSLYFGASINLGVVDIYQCDFYHDFDTTQFNDWYYTSDSTVWYAYSPKMEMSENPFTFFNYEAQIGLQYDINKRFSLELEVSYVSNLDGKEDLKDRVFEKRFNSDYKLVLEGENNFSDQNEPVRFRVFLTYRFGGKLRK